jgi:hypothetical protein
MPPPTEKEKTKKRKKLRKKKAGSSEESWESARKHAWLRELLTISSDEEEEGKYVEFLNKALSILDLLNERMEKIGLRLEQIKA